MQKKIKIILPLIILLTINCFAGSNVEHIFDLAKKSVCKDVATDILNNPLFTPDGRPTGKAGYFISQLNALTATPFPYRFEITNGYKEGFVYYALLGYLNEMNGKIPLAYRCYQNSLACIDEDKSFDHPLPRAEIYLAIGRTCLAAGRYMDAKDWLDNAFLEAGDNLQLQAAIDRVGIQRANEIGDYPEIIFLYQHLEELGSTKNKKSPLLDKEGCPKDGVVERISDLGLRTSDYANYAQILFYSRKDREGFSKLLEGISKYGIDNNLGVKDPLVDKFLNNIMRAEDDEVKYFYDLLGWAIVDARAKAGDEKYLAFLCNARTLFCKVYDFLNPEDDLKKVKSRIDEVKEQIAAGNPPWSVTRNPLSVKRKTRKRKNPGIRGALREIINGKMEESPEMKIDNYLIFADWKLKHRDYKNAGTNYYLASLIATGTFANLEYDGTTTRNAAIIGMINSNSKMKNLKTDTTLLKNNIQFDTSIRANELGIKLYINATNDAEEAKYSSYFYKPYAFTKSHPIYYQFCVKEIKRLCKELRINKASSLCSELSKLNPATLQRIGQQWFGSLFANGNMKDGINAVQTVSLYRSGWIDEEMYIGWCIMPEQIELIYKTMAKVYLADVLKNQGRNYSCFYQSLNIAKNGNYYKAIFEDIENGNYENAFVNYNKMITDYNMISISWVSSTIFLHKKQYKKAFFVLQEAIERRKRLLRLFLYSAPVAIKLTNQEKEILNSCKQYLNPEQIKWTKQFKL